MNWLTRIDLFQIQFIVKFFLPRSSNTMLIKEVRAVLSLYWVLERNIWSFTNKYYIIGRFVLDILYQNKKNFLLFLVCIEIFLLCMDVEFFQMPFLSVYVCVCFMS